MAFDLESYEPVAERLARWWADHPEGRVLTKLVHADAAGVCVRSEVFRDGSDERPYATGYAEETREGHVNRTSALENCETSAVGRALANAGYAGSDASKRPSREEMSKVARSGMTSLETAPSAPMAGVDGNADDPWADLLHNPDSWWDQRADKKNPKGPDFKAKAGNAHWGKAGEPYNGKPQPLALWLRDAPPNWVEAFDAGDPSLMTPPMVSARGGTVADAVAALDAKVVAEGEPPEGDPEMQPF